MSGFEKKINILVKGLNILVYQKISSLFLIKDEINKYIVDHEIIEFINNDKNKDFIEINDINSLCELNSFIQNIINHIEKINILNKTKDSKKINSLLSISKDLDNKYLIDTQLYNYYVIGYNYWRNLRMTKFIKNMFHIKEKKLII